MSFSKSDYESHFIRDNSVLRSHLKKLVEDSSINSNTSYDEHRTNSSKLSIQSLRSLQSEIKRGYSDKQQIKQSSTYKSSYKEKNEQKDNMLSFVPQENAENYDPMWKNQKTKPEMNGIVIMQNYSCESLLQPPTLSCNISPQTDETKIDLTSVDNKSRKSVEEDTDELQIDTLREYYMQNEGELENLQRSQEVFMLEDIQARKNATNSLINLNEDDFDSEILSIQKKARMEQGLIHQRQELKVILHQYIGFIDKLMRDKKRLSEEISDQQNEGNRLRDNLLELMTKYDETENQLKSIFSAYKESLESSKRENATKDSTLVQMSTTINQQNEQINQLILQLQEINNTKFQQQKSDKEAQVNLENLVDILEQNNHIYQERISELSQQIYELSLENKEKQDTQTYPNNYIFFLSEITTQIQNIQLILSNEQPTSETERNSDQQLNLAISASDWSEEQSQIILALESLTECSSKQTEEHLSIQKKLLKVSEMLSSVLQENEKQQASFQQTLDLELKKVEEIYSEQIEHLTQEHQSLIAQLQLDILSNKAASKNIQLAFDLNHSQTTQLSTQNSFLEVELSNQRNQIQELLEQFEEIINEKVELKGLIAQYQDSIVSQKEQIEDQIRLNIQKEGEYTKLIEAKNAEISNLLEVIKIQENSINDFHTWQGKVAIEQIDLLKTFFLNREVLMPKQQYMQQNSQHQQNLQHQQQQFQQYTPSTFRGSMNKNGGNCDNHEITLSRIAKLVGTQPNSSINSTRTHSHEIQSQQSIDVLQQQSFEEQQFVSPNKPYQQQNCSGNQFQKQVPDINCFPDFQ